LGFRLWALGRFWMYDSSFTLATGTGPQPIA
jgi:hypothetical protein